MVTRRTEAVFVMTQEISDQIIAKMAEEDRLSKLERAKPVEKLILPPEYYEEAPKPIPSIFEPQSFEEYVGQTEAKELSRIMVDAALKESRPLPNIMISGEYGLGKTALAQLIMRRYGYTPSLMDGASVNREIPSGTKIIDEIHNLTPEVADTLNIHLDKGNLHIIGCTTNPGQLPSAFRSRFRQLHLKSYTVDELATILEKVVRRKGVRASRSVLAGVGLRSRFNARQATMYLSFIFDLMAVKGQKEITSALAHEAFSKLGVDNSGYQDRDKLYVRALPDDRAIGLQNIAAMTGIDEETIQNELEPYLLRMGVIERTSRGRIKIKDI